LKWSNQALTGENLLSMVERRHKGGEVSIKVTWMNQGLQEPVLNGIRTRSIVEDA
jgi:hypothetical protein